MDRELKNKYLNMLIDIFPGELATDDFKSVLKNIARNDKLREDRLGMFTALYETIPECADNINPELLWNFTFANHYLEEFKIPEHITSIKKYAFCDCDKLTNIKIPDSVTSIEYSAFSYCTSLTSIKIPNSVTSIDYDAFYDCSGLTSIEIPSSITNIEYAVFRNCSGLTSVEIPESVTFIGSYAFENCISLTSIKIPESVAFIGSYAFYNCPNLIVYTKNQYVIDYCKENKIECKKEI